MYIKKITSYTLNILPFVIVKKSKARVCRADLISIKRAGLLELSEPGKE